MWRLVVWKKGAKILKKSVAIAFRLENGSCYIQEDRHLNLYQLIGKNSCNLKHRCGRPLRITYLNGIFYSNLRTELWFVLEIFTDSH